MLKSITMKSSERPFWPLMITIVLSKSLQKSLKVHLSEKDKPSMCIKNMIALSPFFAYLTDVWKYISMSVKHRNMNCAFF